MKLSVILPCYNGAATLAVQLDALTRQHWPGGWEVLVVNNGSTDNSMNIVDRYAGRLPGLVIVEAHKPGTPRKGVPHSYNCGIRFATGDAFVFCEADDEVAPGWLEAMGRALEQHAFVAARLDHRKLNPEWLQPLQGEGYQSAYLSQMKGYPWLAHASGCSFGLRREVIERAGQLDVDFPCVHDTEFSWRAQLAGFAIHFEPAALIHYREKVAHGARFRQGRAWGRDYIKLLQHYGAPAQPAALARKFVALARALPRGGRVWLDAALGRQNGRHDLAQWVWSLGWSVGEILALARDPVAARSDVLARKAALEALQREAGATATPAAPAPSPQAQGLS